MSLETRSANMLFVCLKAILKPRKHTFRLKSTFILLPLFGFGILYSEQSASYSPNPIGL